MNLANREGFLTSVLRDEYGFDACNRYREMEQENGSARQTLPAKEQYESQ